MDSKQVLARFDAERQALALMDHPNIAKVLDGWLHEHRPFFVMELVKGVPITEYCDKCKLAPKERLELFVPVCQAIQHAHQKGIIHRDIKPSNVLVCMQDGKPVPKIIDFGIAKATSQRLTDASLYTEVGQVIGTLEYMSPEQAQMSALDIDTRADVYALGAMLYELLTSTTPLDRKRLKQAALMEVLRLIKEEEPPRPSTRLTQSKETLASVAAQRRTEPARLTKQVRGELDWIVMRCLEKDRTRRYETASALARDVERYLTNEAVEACPPSVSYRLRKLLHRHRATVLTAAVLVALLVAGATISAWQAIRATGAEKNMRTALEESKESQRQAKAVTEYLVKLFRSSDPRVDGRNVKVADLLDRALADLDAKFADSPKLKGDLLFTLGETYDGLRLWAKTAELYDKARALRKTTLGPDHPDTLTAMSRLADVLSHAGRPEEAIQVAEEALRLQEAKLGTDHRDTLDTVAKLGGAYTAASRPADAIRLLESSLKLCKSKLGSGDEVLLATMNNLGLAYHAAGRLPEAVALLQETLNSMKAKFGADHPETLNTTNNLASALIASGRPALAIPMLEDSLPRCKTKLGLDHEITLWAMGTLTEDYEAADQPAKAELLRIQSVASERRLHGNESVELAGTLASLGRNHLLQKKYTEAEPILRECLAIRAKKMPDSWLCFNTKSLLGGSLLGQKKYNDAEPLLLAGYEGMKQREKTIPPQGVARIPEALDRLIELSTAANKPDEAKKWRAERAKYPEAKKPVAPEKK